MAGERSCATAAGNIPSRRQPRIQVAGSLSFFGIRRIAIRCKAAGSGSAGSEYAGTRPRTVESYSYGVRRAAAYFD